MFIIFGVIPDAPTMIVTNCFHDSESQPISLCFFRGVIETIEYKFTI